MLGIVLVDDHPLLRSGLTCLLDATEDLRVLGAAADGPAALRLVHEVRPDVVLLDLCMPGMDGLVATRLLCALDHAPAVVVLTSSCRAASVQGAFAAGAAGYLVKDMPPERLLAALRGIPHGLRAVDPRADRILLRQQRRQAPPAGTDPGARLR